jgi:hypothetical protein
VTAFDTTVLPNNELTAKQNRINSNHAKHFFFVGGTLILCNVVAGTPDTKMDGSCLKLKKVENEIQFITHTLPLFGNTYLEYQ